MSVRLTGVESVLFVLPNLTSVSLLTDDLPVCFLACLTSGRAPLVPACKQAALLTESCPGRAGTHEELQTALDSRSSVVTAQTQCRKASVTLERLVAPPLPAAGVLVWSIVGRENPVHGRNQSCDDGEPWSVFTQGVKAARKSCEKGVYWGCFTVCRVGTWKAVASSALPPIETSSCFTELSSSRSDHGLWKHRACVSCVTKEVYDAKNAVLRRVQVESV